MTPVRKVTTFRIDEELLDAMRRLQERDGILPSEQIRRALRPWLEQKGILTERKRTVTRKRP
jgi:Arc/MetJ-type ribon-helix-helix transcriptional regulator